MHFKGKREEKCILTPRGLSEFCVVVIVIINTVPFGTAKFGGRST